MTEILTQAAAQVPAFGGSLSADSQVTDPLTAADNVVAQHADYYLEYDAEQRSLRGHLCSLCKVLDVSKQLSFQAD